MIPFAINLILIQLKKLEDFKFEDWRDRYVRWMNHKKARVMDFFRKLDLDRDGKLSRREFIDGIIGSSKPLKDKYLCNS